MSDDESDSLEYLNTTYVPKQKPVKRQEESEIEISKHEELERNTDYEKTQAPYGPIWELLKKWEVIYKTKAEAETAATVVKYKLKHMITKLDGGMIFLNESLQNKFFEQLTLQQFDPEKFTRCISNRLLTKNQD